MSGESNADVYASFGVNSAVMSGESVGEHEQNMLALDVAARDGDDAITLTEEDVETTERDLYDNTDPFGMEDDDEGRVQVRIGEEGPDDDTVESTETPSEAPEGDEDFEPLKDVPEDLNAVSEQLGQHEQGLNDMIETAMERGLSAEDVMAIQAEYESDEGLSEGTYAKLAEVGYSRAFVESFVSGQEALVNAYVAQVKEYAGGPEKFDALLTHLETHNADAAESLMNALEARDLGTVKAIINLAGASRSKAFGRQPTRSVTQRAIPAKPQAPKKEAFENRADMIKAMSDPRYRHDAKYRREVEQKVINSNF